MSTSSHRFDNGWRWHLFLLATVLFVVASASGLAGSTPEGDASTFNAAAIIVDYGDGRFSYAWVPFEEVSISGLELLRRSGLPLVTTSFGGLGDGVCRIEKTGCDISACRKRLCQTGERTSPFWQYVRQDAQGSWSSSGLGAGASKVENGDVDGWAWIGTTPALPLLRLDEAMRLAGVSDGLDDVDGKLPAASNRTVGGQVASADDRSLVELLGGAAIIVTLSGAGVFLVMRSRRRLGSLT